MVRVAEPRMGFSPQRGAGGLPLVVDAERLDLNGVIEWGRKKMLEGDYDQAVDYFTSALHFRPGLMHALVSRGYCYLTLGEEDKAQQDFAEVIARDASFNRNIYVLLALCLKRTGDYPQAIRYLSRCIAQFSAFKPALIARGELQLKVRDYEKARMDFRQVLQQDGAHVVARRGLADALRGLGNFREALRQYTRAIEEAVAMLRRSRDFESAGYAQSCEGGDGAAAGGGSRGTATDPGYWSQTPESYDRGGESGTTEEGAGTPYGAPWQFGQSIEEEDDEELQQQQSAPAGQMEESLCDEESLTAFIQDALMRRALILRLMGDLDGCGADLLEVIQTDPQDGLALFWYGKVLVEQGRFKEAPAALQAAIQNRAEATVHAHALLGALHVATWPEPDCKASLRHLQEAARLGPSSQPVRVTLWIASAAAQMQKEPRDARCALGLLDRALQALTTPSAAAIAAAQVQAANARYSGRGAAMRGPTPRGKRAAGSGVAAATALSHTPRGSAAQDAADTPEDARWHAAREFSQRVQELTHGGDLELALECRTYFQLIARDPAQQVAEVPLLLYVLRALALCDLGRWEEAAVDCRRALAIDPKDEAMQFTLMIASGIIKSRASEFEAAIGCFTKAVRIQPASTEARIHRAIVLASAARQGDAGRAPQLLSDAVQDLEAVEQQANIAGTGVPLSAGHLLASCLCGLGRTEEAMEVLQDHARRSAGLVGPDAAAQQLFLEAEVLCMLGRHRKAVKVCTRILFEAAKASPGGAAAGKVEAFVMRGCCWSELGDVESASEDLREALTLAPERADVHEASGDLFLSFGGWGEAWAAFNTAAKAGDKLPARLAYKRALARLGGGSLAAAQKDLNRVLCSSPSMHAAIHARDGVAALQMMMDGEYRQAFVRLNVLLHRPLGLEASGPDRLPSVFQPHELALCRAMCSLYLGEVSAAVHDCEAALDLARRLKQGRGDADSQLSAGASCASGGDGDGAAGPAFSADRGLAFFECEVLYNVALCQLMAQAYRDALVTCEELVSRAEILQAMGKQSICLAWFLIGICHLAIGEASDEVSRKAFMTSYSYDSAYVDDFLQRHGRREGPAAAMGPGVSPGGDAAPAAPGPSPLVAARLRRVGAPPPASAVQHPTSPPQGAGKVTSSVTGGNFACDATEEAVCCLRKEHSRLGMRMAPCRISIKGVIVWAKPSVDWPAIRAPGPALPAGLARLDLLQSHDALSSRQARAPSPRSPSPHR